jgi:MFS family permease
VALIAFALCRLLWLAYLLLFFVGAGMLTVVTGTSTILQVIVPDDKRGRIMSLFTMSFMGTVPVGSLTAGAVAQWIGAPATLTGAGACCSLAGFVVWRNLPLLRAHMRSHYLKLGIIEPERGRAS